MKKKKVTRLVIKSPTFRGFKTMLEYYEVNPLRERFTELYSVNAARYIDRKLNMFFKILFSLANEYSAAILEKFKVTLSVHLYGKILAHLIPISIDAKEDPKLLRIHIDTSLINSFFYADLVIAMTSNDYISLRSIISDAKVLKTKEKYIKHGESLSGRSVDKTNLKQYNKIFLYIDQLKQKGKKIKLRPATFAVFNKRTIEEQKQIYNRFKHFCYTHKIYTLTSFLHYLEYKQL